MPIWILWPRAAGSDENPTKFPMPSGESLIPCLCALRTGKITNLCRMRNEKGETLADSKQRSGQRAKPANLMVHAFKNLVFACLIWPGIKI
jgi:hypothetical protein